MRRRFGLGKVAAVAGIALALCGCAGVFGEDDEATAPPPPSSQSFTFNGVDWQVADNAYADTLTISTTAPQLTGPGTLGGYRLNLNQNAVPDEEFRAAAQGWFARGGRFCSVVAAAQPAAQDDDDDGWFGGMFGGSDDDEDQPPANTRTYSYSCDWLP